MVTIVGKADDAEGCLTAFADGIQRTISYVKDMGWRIAVGKCVLMATEARHRKVLRAREWGRWCHHERTASHA